MITTQPVFEKIKAILNSNGSVQQVSDRFITETVEALLVFTNEETVLDTFVSQVAKTFQSADGNMRNEVAAKIQALKDAEPKPIPAPTLIPTPAPTPTLSDEPEWVKQIKITQAEIMAELAGTKLQRTTADKQAQILTDSKLKYTDSIINSAILDFDFSKETANVDFDSKCNKIGESFGIKPQAAGDGTPQKQNLTAEVTRLQNEGKLPKTN